VKIKSSGLLPAITGPAHDDAEQKSGNAAKPPAKSKCGTIRQPVDAFEAGHRSATAMFGLDRATARTTVKETRGGTQNELERDIDSSEMEQLREETERLREITEYTGRSLLSTGPDEASFQVGIDNTGSGPGGTSLRHRTSDLAAAGPKGDADAGSEPKPNEQDSTDDLRRSKNDR